MAAMTTLLALLSTEEGTFNAPYYIGGGILLILLAAIAALLAFGKGREHS
jgi:hypothetical protein